MSKYLYGWFRLDLTGGRQSLTTRLSRFVIDDKMDCKLRGARVIILKDGKVLLGKRLKRDSFHRLWCTFGGEVKLGETVEQSLKRELKEELGIEVVDPKFLTVFETVAENGSQECAHLRYFLVKDWKGRIANKSEHSEIRWFSLGELKDLPMGWVGKKAIDEYLTASP